MACYERDQGVDGCYQHDPLAVGVAIDPTLVRREEMRVYVETEWRVTAGMTMPFRHSTRDPAKFAPPERERVRRRGR